MIRAAGSHRLQIPHRLTFQRHRVLRRRQMHPRGIVARRQLGKRLRHPRPRHHKVYDLALHRFRRPLS